MAPVNAHDSVAGAPDVTITVRGGLTDRDVRVAAGAIVRFVNRDDERHRLRSRTGRGFDTGDIEPGASYQIRLSTPGTYTYIDERDDEDSRYHGRIVVGGGNSGESTASGAAKPTTSATVTLGDRVVQPSTTTITAGGTVTFRNQDSDEHTATGGIIDSGPLSPGASYRKSFAKAGTYDFLCIFHPEMQGTIRVVAAGGGTAPSPAARPTPTPVPNATPTPAGGDAVTIVDLAFEPATLTVEPGTTVTWTNTGVAPHTVSAKDGSFGSGMLQSGATFEQTFADPGTYAYLCQVHPEMSGTIEVAVTGPAPAAAVASPLPSTTAVPAPEIDAAPAAELEAAPAADLGSLGGIALAITLVSIASALFARVLRGTVRP